MNTYSVNTTSRACTVLVFVLLFDTHMSLYYHITRSTGAPAGMGKGGGGALAPSGNVVKRFVH